MAKLTAEQKVLLAKFKEVYRAHGLSTERADVPRLTAAIKRAYARRGRPEPRIIMAASPWDACNIIARENQEPLSFVSASLSGHMDLYWIAVYMFAKVHLGKVYNEKNEDGLDIMHELGLSSGWCYPYEQGCIVCDRPESIVKDDERRLHNATGPSVRYRDGFEMYSWHGTRIPKNWIVDRTLTAQQALNWKDTDQRTAACQILGWGAILDELKPKIIDVDPNPYFGTLYETKLPDHGVQRFLKARCGTGVDVVVLASNEARTAREAGAISYGCTEDEYNPVLRT